MLEKAAIGTAESNESRVQRLEEIQKWYVSSSHAF